MINNNFVCVLDLETCSLRRDEYSPISLSTLIIDPKKMEIVPDSQFDSLMKPLDFTKIEQKALEVNKITIEQLQVAPDQSVVWGQFVNYLKKYNISNGMFGRPIICGYNIINFDLPIIRALCNKYGNTDKEGNQNIFHNIWTYDLMFEVFWWFNHVNDLQNFKLDTIRQFLGMDGDSLIHAHTSKQDIIDTAKIFIRFQKLKRNLYQKINFRNSFQKTGV